jgi:hypothetical protein
VNQWSAFVVHLIKGDEAAVAKGLWDVAKNDTILLDGIIDQRVSDGFPSAKRDEVFEYLSFEQVLKNYDLSPDELDSGWIDGRDDGGIDGFFIFVNGHLLRDPKDFAWPKTSAEITVWLLTCKHHDTFQQAPLNSLYASVTELFDFSIDREHFKGAYSASLAHARALFQIAYRKLAAASPTLVIRYAYVSRGDASAVEPNVRARADQIVEVTRPLFSSSECRFDFLGAAELVAMHRRAKRFSIELPVHEFLSRGQSGYVVLSGLKEYASFVTDDAGNLRRYLFDSNVRDYLGSTTVNADILRTLADSDAPDFWWLNNGVTILATDATVVGKTINLVDIQIVNGLQTTESIYRHFRNGGCPTGDRSLLIKIIVSKDVKHRDRIIQATNNQNVVETAGLRASDKVQRDIEEYLERHGWYYERRKNYYKNIGKPQDRFVTPLYLACGYVSLVMKNPANAARLRARFMRRDESYKAVFSDRDNIHIWVAITEILKRVEAELNKIRPAGGMGERFLAMSRNLIAFLVVSKILGRFAYSINDLIKFDFARIDAASVGQIWKLVLEEMEGVYRSAAVKKSYFVEACCTRAAADFAIGEVQAIGRKGVPDLEDKERREAKERRRQERRMMRNVSNGVVDRVQAVLPDQPWKPGVHREIARQLGLDPIDVSAAIGQLIRSGRRNRQRDGVVYDLDGRIIGVDYDRVQAKEDVKSQPDAPS